MTQLTDTILMIRPAKFGYNPNTADDNAFQHTPKKQTDEEIAEQARKEFDAFVDELKSHGVNILVLEETEDSNNPDAVFLNNWFSTHDDGSLFLYPMYAPNRRSERRADLQYRLRDDHGYHIRRIVDYIHFEEQEKFAESTGSIVLDRTNKLAYVCWSERSDPYVVERVAFQLGGYKVIGFTAKDQAGQNIYHTNVMMSIGTHHVVICLDSIVDPMERKLVLDSFKVTEKEIVEITMDQMHHFLGNMLFIKNKQGEPLIAMSSQAYNALTKTQKSQLTSQCTIVHSDLSTIEYYGGGSARCMMAEIFLPKK